jgi:hypothetical protein
MVGFGNTAAAPLDSVIIDSLGGGKTWRNSRTMHVCVKLERT